MVQAYRQDVKIPRLNLTKVKSVPRLNNFVVTQKHATRSPRTFMSPLISTDSGRVTERYKTIIFKQKRMIQAEQKHLRQVYNEYSREIQTKNESEALLRNCIEDVRGEILKLQFNGFRVNESKNERVQVIEKLLGEEEFLSKLYEAVFPIKNNV